ncbi:DUF2304 family protein [Candidatus Woesearchaeota archaeon]|nr:DUF2304 family protein [Candidatus Woesearchaeota archaeon]
MELIQVLIVLFALFAFSRVIIRVKKKDITKGEFIFWTLVWILVIFVALLPNLSIYLAKIFGVERGTDVFVYLGLVLLFYLVFRMYVKMEKTEQGLTKVVREISFRKKK